MMKQTHLTVGIAAGSIAAISLGDKITPVILLSAACGSLFPDADHPSGSINSELLAIRSTWFKALFYLALAVGLFHYVSRFLDKTAILYLVPIFVAIAISKHRGITHSIPFLIYIYFVLIMFKTKYNFDILTPFTVGAFSHIFIDMFNPQGVELFWPYKRNFRFPFTISTGGVCESVLNYLFLIGFLVICYKYGLSVKELLNVVSLR